MQFFFASPVLGYYGAGRLCGGNVTTPRRDTASVSQADKMWSGHVVEFPFMSVHCVSLTTEQTQECVEITTKMIYCIEYIMKMASDF